MDEIDSLLKKMEEHPLPVKVDLKLDRIKTFMEKIGNPHKSLPPVVHVAGTNGKGSLISFLRAILENAGYKTHIYTSPHLVHFRERIVLSGEEINDNLLLDYLKFILKMTEEFPLTYFESTTALAFHAFANHKADILLLETGLGGRYDATNIVDNPLLTAITPVSFDHQNFLGDKLEQIAFEKAGIIKENVTCIVGEQKKSAKDIIAKQAEAKNSQLYMHGMDWAYESLEDDGRFNYISFNDNMKLNSLKPSLQGTHQLHNAAMAIATISQLKGYKISKTNIAQGITNARWPARMQKITKGPIANKFMKFMDNNIEIWLDGGHNQAAGEAIAQWLKNRANKDLHLIVGMIEGRNSLDFLKPLIPFASTIQAIAIPGENSAKKGEEILSEIHSETQKYNVMLKDTNYNKALEYLEQQELNDCDIILLGSLYFAGFVLAENA